MTVHRDPPKGVRLTPCCNRTPTQLPLADQLTVVDELVTCHKGCGGDTPPLKRGDPVRLIATIAGSQVMNGRMPVRIEGTNPEELDVIWVEIGRLARVDDDWSTF